MEANLLFNIVPLFGLAVAVLFVCHKIGVPVVVGFLLTGILAGPHGLLLIRTPHDVEVFAEIGVVLLLFTIGIEFSTGNLWKLRRSVLVGGTSQVLLSILITVMVAVQFGIDWRRALFFGFLVSLSSTAIVLTLFQERAEIESPHGKTTLAILIFQDVVAVPMMLAIPLLAGGGPAVGPSLLLLLAKIGGIVLVALVSAKWIVPHFLHQIAVTRSRELFLFTVIVICFAIAVLTAALGLSLALGAFLAGLILSESQYNYQALSNVLPFRDVFTSIFFISIGMLLDVGVIMSHPVLTIAIAAGVMVLKTMASGGAAALLGFPLRTVLLCGLSLSQVGEFSFILAGVGAQSGLFSQTGYGLFISVSVLTMAATPFIISGGPRLAEWVLKLPLPARLKSGSRKAAGLETGTGDGLQDHLVIIGYGVTGRNVARAAKSAGIPYRIIEMNPATVRAERANGEPIFYGDASREAVLEHAALKGARVMVVGIPDALATRMTVVAARRLNPALHIVARTRFLQEMSFLRELGADEVIPEDFETSVEIFTRVLAKYLVPRDEIEKMVAEIRKEGYRMFRSLSPEATDLCPEPGCDIRFYFPNLEITVLRVQPGAAADGKTLAELALRNRHRVTLLAIRRDSTLVPNPGGDTRLMPQDLCILMGSLEDIASVKALVFR